MKELKKYNISIAQLENKVFTYLLDGGAEFFNQMQIEAGEGGHFQAKIELSKSETMINLAFEIEGVLNLICDRSLDEFEFPFSTKDSIILKFGDHDEELADGIKIINRSTQQINVAQDIYELISLTIPMKKLHPRYMEEEKVNEEGFVVYSTKLEETEETTNEDPRWAVLKKLK
ncbi:MAG: DUF177 domain-containing protein [Bacteroidota bacterium]